MILVTGASGMVGREVARALRARGLPIRLFARSASKLPADLAGAGELVVGEFAERKSVDAAMRGVERLYLTSFDGPDAAVSCGRRINTTVAPQALALLNDAFLRDRAVDFARRLLTESGKKPEDWVDRGYRLALSRPPSETERLASLQFLRSQAEHRAGRDRSFSPEGIQLQALTDYCQALFSLNEFVYVD